jgi:hypothetical protein
MLLVRVATHLLEIRRYAQSLIPQPQVRCNGDTVFAHHGYDGATVIFHDRLCGVLDGITT